MSPAIPPPCKKEARCPLGPAASAGPPSNRGARRRHAGRMGEVRAIGEGRGALPLVPPGVELMPTPSSFSGLLPAACAFHVPCETRPRKFVVDLPHGNGTVISGLGNGIGSWRLAPALSTHWSAPDLQRAFRSVLAVIAGHEDHGCTSCQVQTRAKPPATSSKQQTTREQDKNTSIGLS